MRRKEGGREEGAFILSSPSEFPYARNMVGREFTKNPLVTNMVFP